MTIQDNLLHIQAAMKQVCQQSERGNDLVQLLAVTKKASLDQLKVLVNLGQRHFGENRLDHLTEMATALADKNIVWHFIGHLQRNKVKEVLQCCSWVQSVDSIRLVDKLQQVAQANNRPLNILIQLNISGEQQKTGLAIEALNEMVEKALQCSHLNLRGLMCMAPLSDDPEMSRSIFTKCAKIFEQIKQQYNLGDHFDTLSMGMSNDFTVAIACGATQIRIGSAIIR